MLKMVYLYCQFGMEYHPQPIPVEVPSHRRDSGNRLVNLATPFKKKKASDREDLYDQ